MNDSLIYSEPVILPQPGLKSAKVRNWPVKHEISENFMKIYPNPANKILIIEVGMKEFQYNARIQIINTEGIILREFSLNKQNDYIILPLSDFNSGLYLCKLHLSNDIIEAKKFIISRF